MPVSIRVVEELHKGSVGLYRAVRLGPKAV